ncbi:STAS/SEC14 domain-containing protein [Niveibacterium sp. SC-1]|uniref:STAS/SEC14 domain-containing protein n=1 Tax=Niveibacterium sp. SC-1 TaxID=3135646 RepID=UPI003120474A
MITVELRDSCVEAAIFGELTITDFRQLEQQIEVLIGSGRPLRAFVDLRAMKGLTLDAAIEDFRFARKHADVEGRIAVLTENDLDSIPAWMEQVLISADLRLFDDEYSARAWLLGQADIPTEMSL